MTIFSLSSQRLPSISNLTSSLTHQLSRTNNLNHSTCHTLQIRTVTFSQSSIPFSTPHRLPINYHPPLTLRRNFRFTPPRNDLFGFGVFSCSIPVFKSFLLSLTRATLVILPFWYRWKLARYFPRASRTLLTIPLFAMCLVIAIGIDQSPRTHRWRLLLMSESEEVEWSHRRCEDLLASEGHAILGPEDPRTILVKEICDRLMAAVDLDSPVSANTLQSRSGHKERIQEIKDQNGIQSCTVAGSDSMPWKPESSNPQKILECPDWELFIIDLPRINAFVLPTKAIFVYTGLLELIKNNEELTAAIIAHEISHVIERHAVENMGVSALSTVIFDAMRGISYALTISFPLVSDVLGSIINYLNNAVTERAYSRKLELEADELGLMIMARAGYNPQAALTLWKILSQLECDKIQTQKFSEQAPWTRTHPTGKDRELMIQKSLPQSMKFFAKANNLSHPTSSSCSISPSFSSSPTSSSSSTELASAVTSSGAAELLSPTPTTHQSA